ncbi:MopE-related protein [Pyxidicoccus sp. MSG2]|uniref:MopE-related protein n=1 Tax=Pyxidicoccus sp. MSG2 TaxID=2996790 RepID=UPI00226F6076|nr:MopE-related protein [Pyxidicoccus sp. MSG2]MCY1018230.1 MopE-related protein [Pyxidicoccus sp. MSG2]
MNNVKSCCVGLLSALFLVACDEGQTGNESLSQHKQALAPQLPAAGFSLSEVQPPQRFPGVSGSRAGSALVTGDLNGDGLSDIVVGAPGPSSGSYVSKLYILQGNADADISTASPRIEGVSAYRAGSSLAIGHFTGTTRSDLLIGAPGYNVGGLNRGAAYLMNGDPLPANGASLSSTTVARPIPGQASPDMAGSAVAIGDVIGGGDADIIVGAPNRTTGTGVVYVLSGPINLASLPANLSSSTTVITGAAGSQTGAAVTTADVNGDGRADLVVGAPKYNGMGAVFVFFGPLSTGAVSLASANLTLLGATANELAGTSVASVGDLDGDGDEELLIGAPGTGALPGRAYLAYGGASGSVGLSTLPQFVGSPGDLAGTSVARVGDADGDTRVDFLVGAPGYGSGAGAVYLVYGGLTPFTGTRPLSDFPWFEGEAAGDAAGTAVAGAVDVNGDRKADIVIGAPGAAARGTVYVLTLRKWFGDIDGDGYGDPNNFQEAYFAPTPGNWVLTDSDCDDQNDEVHPDAAEVCNGIDDNCNDLVDIDDPTITDARYFFNDLDGDGRIDLDADYTFACFGPQQTIAFGDELGYECSGIFTDDDPNTYDGAPEVCDSKDNNCDGPVDEGVTTTYYRDADEDTFGDPSDYVDACAVPEGYVTSDTDCDDTRDTVKPGATEVCNGLDDNCDSQTDVNATWYADLDQDGFGSDFPYAPIVVPACGPPPTGYANNKDDCNDRNPAILGPPTWYRDSDGDGFGDAEESTKACTLPAGYVAGSSDCDDTNAAVTEIHWYQDTDGDGFGNPSQRVNSCSGAPAGYVAPNTDCNDTNASVSPAQTEVCNGVDDNCGGGIDEGVKSTYYRDADGDGFGNASNTTQACSAPSGYTADSTDCNDADSTLNPNTRWYADTDSDGYGSTTSVASCVQPAGHVRGNTDCDDTRNSTYPGASEFCNGRDDDCDAVTDEDTSVDATLWYRDADGDSHGTLLVSTRACAAPSGHVGSSDDCNDGNASMYPGNTEVCDGVDNDCDFDKDEDVKTTYYRDNDGDGYGSPFAFQLVCSAPAGYVTNNEDCNDNSSSIAPNRAEVCNEVDDNCNNAIDEGVKTVFYADLDGDGFGTTNASYSREACTAPPGYTQTTGDCDDRRSEANPGGTEVCDLLDNDCNGSIDEGVQLTWYQDADNDGFGVPGVTTLACLKPTGYAAVSTDCNDGRSDMNPGRQELCEAVGGPQVDNDCDGDVDDAINTRTWYVDGDGDGFGLQDDPVQSCGQPAGHTATSGDCDDTRANVHPDAAESCETSGPQIDNNCNGDPNDDPNAPVWYGDGDRDNYAGTTFKLRWCTNPTDLKDANGNTIVDGKYVASLTPTDCNDSNPSINPGATEACNHIDDNCNSQTDEGVQAAYYPDRDGDGCGDINAPPSWACGAPGTCGFGFVSNNNDTNDNNPSVCN